MNKYRVYDSITMKKIEEQTASIFDISVDKLVYIAGKHLCEAIMTRELINKNDSILIVYGSGNNGADALIVGDYLLKNNYQVAFLKAHEHTSNIQREILSKMDHSYHLNHVVTVEKNQYDAVIDGIFGIGLNRKLEMKDISLIQTLNQNCSKIISIDIPSGINPDSGLSMGAAIVANYTLICQAYKRGNLLNDAKDHSLLNIVIDIGLKEPIHHNEHFIHIKQDELIFPQRKENTHKYHYGHLLVIGGSLSMFGAPILSAHAGLRSGAGLVTWALDEKYMRIPTNQKPDIMKAYIKNKPSFKEIINRKDAIVFGMGLGKNETLFSSLLEEMILLNKPILIDADGLLACKSLQSKGINLSKVILTPHLMELSRMIDMDINEIKENPINAIQKLHNQGAVLLKGPCTIVKHENDFYYFLIGNAGMAKAGFGDVLSGIIGALLLKHQVIDAIFKGLFIFHYAGEITKIKYGENSMMASDLIENIHQVIHKEL
jgi:ADP-dependent NAD(P)H-hydrate dehydratase / NAD(P)H-hydrate epimerase